MKKLCSAALVVVGAVSIFLGGCAGGVAIGGDLLFDGDTYTVNVPPI